MSIWDDIKKFAQPYAADEEEYEDEYEDELEEEYQEEPAPRYSRRREAAPAKESTGFPSETTTVPFSAATAASPVGGFTGSLVNSSTGAKQKVVLKRPSSFNDAPEIATNLRDRKAAIVLNLEGVDRTLARRVVDFLSGCTFAVRGNVTKVSEATYMFCPEGMEVEGELKNLQVEVDGYV